MTNWILNGQKGSYDWEYNKEYKKCPYCGSQNNIGDFNMGYWEKKYRCGSIIKAEWGNDGYIVNYDIRCQPKEGKYYGKEVIGRILC